MLVFPRVVLYGGTDQLAPIPAIATFFRHGTTLSGHLTMKAPKEALMHHLQPIRTIEHECRWQSGEPEALQALCINCSQLSNNACRIPESQSARVVC
jgi:hypothetical protein